MRSAAFTRNSAWQRVGLAQRHVMWHVAVAMAALLMMLGTPGSAGAHAELRSTSPQDGQVLETAPAEVVIAFNETVDPVDDGAQLFDESGTAKPLESRLDGTSVRYPLPDDLPNGSYVATWRVISADGHPIAGSIQFAIGAPGSTPIDVDTGNPGQAVDRLLAVAQGLGYAGLLGIGGWLLFHVWIARRAFPESFWVPAGLLLTITCIFLWLPLTVARQEGRGVAALGELATWTTKASTDLRWMVALAILGLGVAFISGFNRPFMGQGDLIVIGVLVSLASVSVLGHTRIVDPGWLIIISNTVHVAAAAIWFGGLIGLAQIIRRLPANGDIEEAAGFVARFSTVAGFTLAAVLVCGVLSAGLILRSFTAMYDNDYGRILMLKAGLVLAVMAIAGWNRFRLVPHIVQSSAGSAWPRFRRLLAAEITIIVCVALVTGFLVNQSPRDSTSRAMEMESPAAEPTPIPIAVDAIFGDGRIVAIITPGASGQNTIAFQMLDASGQSIVAVDPPRLELSLPTQGVGPLSAESRLDGAGTGYLADITLPLPGEWTMSVTARISTFTSVEGDVTFSVP